MKHRLIAITIALGATLALSSTTLAADASPLSAASLSRKVNEYEGQHRKVNEYEGQHRYGPYGGYGSYGGGGNTGDVVIL
jgi:hypothetical protein